MTVTTSGAATDRSLASGLALAVAGAVAFSGKAILAKLMYRHGVDAVQVLFWRMLLALPLFLALAWWAGRGRPAFTRRDWMSIVGLGFCGYYLASLLDFLGLQYVTASLERLILYLNPTLVLLLSIALGKVRLRARQAAAMALSYAGVLVVFGQELRFEGAQTAQVALGSVLVFGSAVSYAIYLVASGEVVQRLGALRLTGAATSVACVFAIAQLFVLREPSAALVPAPVVWLSLANAVFTTFAPVVMVMMAIERIGAPLAAQCGMVGPMSTILLGVVLLGEPFTGLVVAGTALVLCGVWLLAKWRY
ncbi:MAG TPA: DMT family transporter [Burkholderiaceae bacterium]|nr:DMT family transporter [Burkholderiaceae bacterium]